MVNIRISHPGAVGIGRQGAAHCSPYGGLEDHAVLVGALVSECLVHGGSQQLAVGIVGGEVALEPGAVGPPVAIGYGYVRVCGGALQESAAAGEAARGVGGLDHLEVGIG